MKMYSEAKDKLSVLKEKHQASRTREHRDHFLQEIDKSLKEKEGAETPPTEEPIE